jgi:RNA polymerase sigma-70 factor (sigma-E family)
MGQVTDRQGAGHGQHHREPQCDDGYEQRPPPVAQPAEHRHGSENTRPRSTTIGAVRRLLLGVARDPDLEQVFRDFVAARSPALQRTAYLLVGDWGLAEDLVQTALIKTYLAARGLGGVAAFEPYARTVLVHTAGRWWRRRWRGERPTAVLPERPVADAADASAERDRVWRLILTLPVRQRAVLVLRFYEDLTEAQTAGLLGLSIGTVKSHTSRALATLRQRMSGAAAALEGSTS